MGEHEVGDVARGPLVEEAGVAVLALGIDPHVETLGHDHHAQRVAEVHLQLGGHVVGGADGIAAHLFHRLDLTDEGGLVDGGAQRSEVVVQAELETALFRHLDGADAEGLGDGVLDVAEAGFVEIGCLRCPQLGVLDGEGAEAAVGDILAVGVVDVDAHVGGARGDVDGGLRGRDAQCADIGLPGVDPVGTRGDERDRAVEACSGVPARALLDILEVDFEQVVASLHEGSDIYAEGVVAVGPVASLLTVEIDGGLGHGTVEEEFGMGTVGGYLDDATVVALANPGQGTRASALLGGLSLAILFDSHALEVPLLVEGSGDGPVVGHADRCPVFEVVGEAPSLFEDGLLTGLATNARGDGKGQC